MHHKGANLKTDITLTGAIEIRLKTNHREVDPLRGHTPALRLVQEIREEEDTLYLDCMSNTMTINTMHVTTAHPYIW